MNVEHEIEELRQRVHGFSDVLQAHALKIHVHGLELTAISKLVERCATQEQLEHALLVVTKDVQIVGKDVETIKNAMTWTVALVVGTVIIAVLAMVLK